MVVDAVWPENIVERCGLAYFVPVACYPDIGNIGKIGSGLIRLKKVIEPAGFELGASKQFRQLSNCVEWEVGN